MLIYELGYNGPKVHINMSVISNVQIGLTVLSSSEIGDNSMSVLFKRPIGFNYEAGDWADILNLGEELRGGKTYSFSSSPTESELAITFRKGISPFKQHLQNVRAGDELVMTQYGNDYSFHLRENRSSVLIAGGIGIAPFRSMLKQMADTADNNFVQLLYFNKGKSFIFSDEINGWATSLNLVVEYVDTTELKRKDRQKIFQTVMDQNAHHYF
ncbi:MAG: FAD-binding oxidoreductase, partial [Sphingomonadales bacterium]|nr:FAD-binding oxidoreductase [Sphingomonadales bacterium]